MQAVTKGARHLSVLYRNASALSRCTCCVTRCTTSKFFQQPHAYSTESIAPPLLEGEEKQYAPKIQQIVEEIGQLTLLEVSDLNELLKKTLKITDAPVMAMGAAAAPAPVQEEEVEVKQEKTLFTVKLTKFDAAKKIAVIKEIKSLIAGMNLVQAKKFVESAPQDVKVDISKEEAETLKKALEAVGGSVEIE